MQLNPSVILPYLQISPVSGAEEQFRIGVDHDKDGPVFSFESIDGWVACPDDFSETLRSNSAFISQVAEALALIEMPQVEESPGF